jgi:hypothetical protein
VSRTARRRVRDRTRRRAWHGHLSAAVLDEVERIARRRDVTTAEVVEDALALGVAAYKVDEALADAGALHPLLDYSGDERL